LLKAVSTPVFPSRNKPYFILIPVFLETPLNFPPRSSSRYDLMCGSFSLSFFFKTPLQVFLIHPSSPNPFFPFPPRKKIHASLDRNLLTEPRPPHPDTCAQACFRGYLRAPEFILSFCPGEIVFLVPPVSSQFPFGREHCFQGGCRTPPLLTLFLFLHLFFRLQR